MVLIVEKKIHGFDFSRFAKTDEKTDDQCAQLRPFTPFPTRWLLEIEDLTRDERRG